MSGKKKVKLVLPVYNEEKELKDNVLRLRDYVLNNLTNWEVTTQIVDNASTDKTAEIGNELSARFKEISFLHLPKKGRGRAIKKAWEEEDADIFVYMDIDLSTDLRHLPALISAIENDYDIAIGSRLLPNSKVIGRTLKREIISRSYNFLIKILFQTHFSDAQCGFKAVNSRVIKELLPKIQDNEWFFDSELLIIGEKTGYKPRISPRLERGATGLVAGRSPAFKIYEEPVIWTDNPGSTVRVLKTVLGDLKGLFRLFFSQPWKLESEV